MNKSIKLNTSQYYKVKKTGQMFRVWHKARSKFLVYRQYSIEYFDGLLQRESREELMGDYKTKDLALKSMLKN